MLGRADSGRGVNLGISDDARSGDIYNECPDMRMTQALSPPNLSG
jgi:hypothetical protein